MASPRTENIVFTEKHIIEFYLLVCQGAYDENIAKGLQNPLKNLASQYLLYLGSKATQNKLFLSLLQLAINKNYFQNRFDDSILKLIGVAESDILKSMNEDEQLNLYQTLKDIKTTHENNANEKSFNEQKSYLSKTVISKPGLDENDRRRVTDAKNTQFFLHHNKHLLAYQLYLAGIESLNKNDYLDAINKFASAYSAIAHECSAFNSSCQRNLATYKEAEVDAILKYAHNIERQGFEAQDVHDYTKAMNYYLISEKILLAIKPSDRTIEIEETLSILRKNIASLYYCMGNDSFSAANFFDAIRKYNLAVQVCSALPTDSQTEICLPIFKEGVEKAKKSLDEKSNNIQEHLVSLKL